MLSVDSLPLIPIQKGGPIDNISIHRLSETEISLLCLYSKTNEFCLYNTQTKGVNMVSLQLPSCSCSLKAFGPNAFFFFHECISTIFKFDNKKILTSIPQDTKIFSDLRVAVANEEYLIAIGVKKMYVWSITATDLSDPYEYSLEAFVSIASPRDKTCLINNRLLLINNNPGGHLFQVWTLPSSVDDEPVLDCYAESEKNTEILYNIDHTENYVVATLNDSIQVWNIKKKGKLTPVVFYMPKKALATSISISDETIVVGDNFGNIFLFDLFGSLAYSFISENTDIWMDKIEISKLKTFCLNKVNKCLRFGRHVFAVSDSGKVKMIDIFTGRVETTDSKLPIKDFKIKKITDENGNATGTSIICLCFDKKKKTYQVLTWGLSIIVTNTSFHELVLNSLETIFQQLIVRECDKNELFLIHSRIRHSNDTSVPVPFIIYKDLINVIEEYCASCKNKSDKSSMEKIMAKAQHASNVFIQVYTVLKRYVDGTEPNFKDCANDISTKVKESTSNKDSSPESHSKSKKNERNLQMYGTGISALLHQILDAFEVTNKEYTSYLSNFDSICNKGIEDKEKLPHLIDIYMKVKQFSEDAKEIGRIIGEYNGDSSKGEWWEFGGKYDE